MVRNKNCCTISALLIVDDNKCIGYANVGWPGIFSGNNAREFFEMNAINRVFDFFSHSPCINNETALPHSWCSCIVVKNTW